ncbi:MAG: NAD(P)-dependent oxidoreductase [Firmicutes bacterium]|nr:NAD(P)-dependent oxidoreductase [Bacillota bacterium]
MKASNSGPKDISTHGIETMLDNFNGIYELLEYASCEDVKNTLYISSSEVYGSKKSIEPFSENEYGWVDILSPRSSYSSSKRAAETLCACFSDERGIKTTIVRPGHIYGPTARRNDSHVSAVFSFNVADEKDLVMKSTGEQIRSWCYCLDSTSAILTILVKGQNMNAYNISNPSSVASIKDMAELLAKGAGVKLVMDVPDAKEKKAFNPMQNSSLNSEKLMSLGWNGLFDARTGFEHTVRIIKEGKL